MLRRRPVNTATRLPVNSSHGHLITRSCRHTVNSSTSQLVTHASRHKVNSSQASYKNAIPVTIFYLHAGQVAPINSAEHGRRNYGKRVYTRHTNAVQFDLLIWV